MELKALGKKSDILHWLMLLNLTSPIFRAEGFSNMPHVTQNDASNDWL
jgi:hypothetical protein